VLETAGEESENAVLRWLFMFSTVWEIHGKIQSEVPLVLLPSYYYSVLMKRPGFMLIPSIEGALVSAGKAPI
jgi:hypothetical protein